MNGVNGLNVRTLGISRDQVMSAATKLAGAFLLVQDDTALVAQAHAAGFKVIYRRSGDGSLPADPAGLVRQMAQEAPDADYLYWLNEIDPSPEQAANTMTAMQTAVQIKRKLLISNYATNRSLAQWQASLSTLQYAVLHEMGIGFHLYIDGTHDDGGLAWQTIKHQVGGTWICSEFAYIRTIFDGNHGWKGAISQAQYSDFARKWVPILAAENVAIQWFSEDDWPPSNDGKSNGFGLWQAADFLSTLSSLNQQYKEATVSPIPAPVPQLTSATVTATADPSGANIRASFTTSSAIIGKLRVGDSVMYSHMAIQGGVYSVGSAIRHDWTPLGQGYVAAGVISLKDAPSTPVKPAPASVIDVSEAQGVIDWKTVAAAGVHTAFIRASQGATYMDKQFVANVTGALAAGLKVGLYHAYLPNDNADIQASNFLKAVAPYRFKLTYPLIVDVERQNGMTPTQVADGLLTLLNVLDGATGQKSWIYTAEGPWNAYVGAQHDAVFSQHALWVANFTSASKPAMPRCWGEGNWVFWQYSSTGKVAGIDEKHNVDLDRAHA